ncbi:MAG: FtsX-like permease family protein [Bacteroidetes bacterium]|jgi:putative ABC transport system permease protein|nr:FtsX-like permease family protein [Bacteroidota bacterium]
MFKNYFIVAWRSLWRNKLYSFINLAGLSVGISCCVLILLYLRQELSYDDFNEKAPKICRVTSVCQLPTGDRSWAITPACLLPRTAGAIPEIEIGTRLLPAGGDRSLAYGEKKLYDTKVFFADSSVFDVFTLPVLKGDARHLLMRPYSVVLTETTAKKYFGNEDPIGKAMKLSDSIVMEVTGVIQDIPLNSHVQMDALVSRNTLMSMFADQPEFVREVNDNWLSFDTYTYLVMNDRTEAGTLEKKLNAFIATDMAEKRRKTGIGLSVKLQALRDIHLYSNLENELEPFTNSDISYVYIFSAAALLILLVACCNFINLSTARSQNRMKEIGLRKVVGGSRMQLIGQFLGESVLFSLLAGLVSFCLVLALIPYFNSFVTIPLQLNTGLVWIYLAITLCTGLIAGLYPAFLLSSFRPVVSLKGRIRHGWTDVFFRKGLVVFQFSVAVILIILSTVIFRQLDFIQNRKIGMNKEQLVQMELRYADIDKAPVMLEEMLKQPGTINGSLNNFSFSLMSVLAMVPEGSQNNKMDAQNLISVDEKFLSTFGIQLVAGRDFSKETRTDSNASFIINEAAVKAFNWGTPQQALGKKIDVMRGHIGPVIGVVKDFNFASLHGGIRPLVMHVLPDDHVFVTLRLQPDHIAGAMKKAEATWKRIATDSPFNYIFLEDEFNSLYKNEQKMRSIVGIFTGLALFVACLGLFGLAAFSIRQRIKEIGIRKVLGAGTFNIAGLLSGGFLKLVLVAVIIALPLSWLLGDMWLRNFAYKTDISWWIFAVAGTMALLIAFVTVSLQAIKAANSNPAKSLRTE